MGASDHSGAGVNDRPTGLILLLIEKSDYSVCQRGGVENAVFCRLVQCLAHS